jgi:hypothetical protein
MPLTMWYDKAGEDFKPKPIQVSGVDLRPGEEVYMAVDDVKFSAYRPSPLFEGMTTGEAPAKVKGGARDYGDIGDLGQGRLVVTSERMIWQGPEAKLTFKWSTFSAASMILTTLYIRYGPAPYRFALPNNVPLRTLNYIGPLVEDANAAEGRHVRVSHYRGAAKPW